jgi:hypothetical protein
MSACEMPAGSFQGLRRAWTAESFLSLLDFPGGHKMHAFAPASLRLPYRDGVQIREQPCGGAGWWRQVGWG